MSREQFTDALRPWQRLYPDLLDVVTLATLFELPGKKPGQPRLAQFTSPIPTLLRISSTSASPAWVSRFAARQAL